MDWPTCEVDDDYHLLIPSRFPPVPLYERLGGPAIQLIAEQLEAKTNPRLRDQERVAQGDASSPSSNRLQNWNHAPFAYPNPKGTAFLSPGYKIPEFIKGLIPALVVAVERREEFLAATNEPPIDVEMRAIVRRVKGSFVDLTAMAPEPDRQKRWEIGARIFESDAQGIVFLMPGFENIRAIAVFDPATLGRALQSDHFRFVWDGKGIRTIGNFSTREAMDRDKLLAECSSQAA